MEHRRQFILEQVEQRGVCSYQELTELLGVSGMTIRRDVDELARRGVVIKTLGGVRNASPPSSLHETALHSRLAAQRQEKQAIAREALELITSQTTLFLDGSTTCLELAKLVASERKGLTIVTNSLFICMESGKGSENRIIGIGGHYDTNSLCFVGPQAEDAVKSFFVDVAFVSTKGFIPTEGTFESFVPTFRIKQIIAKRCAELVLLADHTKFGQRALSKVLDVAQIYTVVTDDKTRRADLASLKRRGKRIRVASTHNSPLGSVVHVA